MARVRLYSSLPLEAAHHVLSEALSRRAMVVALCRCRVQYEGRGSSRLGEGERLLIVKPDGVVLVHRPRGHQPVNWQPESRSIEVRLGGGSLLLRSVRERPREVLEVYIDSVEALVVAEDVRDEAEFIEYLDEHEVRDILARHPEELEEGLRVLRVEKPVGQGYVDIFCVDREGRPVIVEVKRVTAGREAVLQLKRYVDAVKSENPGVEVRGILAAPSIAKEALILLRSLGLEYRRIDPAKLYKRYRSELRRRGGGSSARSLLSFLGGG